MSCDIDSDSFHGKYSKRRAIGGIITTKKGDRRKTVSKRRAYVNTPSNIKRQLQEIEKYIMKNPNISADTIPLGLIQALIRQMETGISMGR